MKSVLIIFLKIGITALSIIKQKGVSLFNVTKYNKNTQILRTYHIN